MNVFSPSHSARNSVGIFNEICSIKKEAPAKSEDTNPPRQACQEFDRIDLYEPLSWIITLRPQHSFSFPGLRTFNVLRMS